MLEVEDVSEAFEPMAVRLTRDRHWLSIACEGRSGAYREIVEAADAGRHRDRGGGVGVLDGAAVAPAASDEYAAVGESWVDEAFGGGSGEEVDGSVTVVELEDRDVFFLLPVSGHSVLPVGGDGHL